MKMFVANPEVAWPVAESLTIATPGPIEEPYAASGIG